nr:hypothetical protein [Tanacetum cinerariifolium]
MFQCLGQYPTSVRVFSDPILFLAGLKPFWEYGQQRPAIMAEPSSGFGTGSLSVSVNTEPLKANEEPVIQPVKDKKYKTRGGSSRPPIKRKLAPGSSISRATRAKTCSSNDNAPLLTVSDDDDGRLSNMERAKEEECEGLRVKCEDAMTEFEKNLVVVALREKIFDPFDLSKVKGYRSSYKKDYTQANNDFATTTFPWLDEFVADPLAPTKVLLSKKPLSFQ